MAAISFFRSGFFDVAIRILSAYHADSYRCKTWFLVFPQEHFLILELYFCQQYPQQYDSIVPPKLTNAFCPVLAFERISRLYCTP